MFEFTFEKLARLAETADTKMAQERLRGNESDRYLVAQAASFQRMVRLEQELIGRAQTTRTRGAADNHWPGVAEKRCPGIPCFLSLSGRH